MTAAVTQNLYFLGSLLGEAYPRKMDEGLDGDLAHMANEEGVLNLGLRRRQ